MHPGLVVKATPEADPGIRPLKQTPAKALWAMTGLGGRGGKGRGGEWLIWD